jgi:hypothetical protein
VCERRSIAKDLALTVDGEYGAQPASVCARLLTVERNRLLAKAIRFEAFAPRFGLVPQRVTVGRNVFQSRLRLRPHHL